MIVAGIGRFGPYLKHGDVFKSIRGDDDVLTIGLNRAVVLLAEASANRRTPPGKALGDHPADSKPITLHSGRYGPYLRHGNIIASLPRGMSEEEVTLEIAVPHPGRPGRAEERQRRQERRRREGQEERQESRSGRRRRRRGCRSEAALTQARGQRISDWIELQLLPPSIAGSCTCSPKETQERIAVALFNPPPASGAQHDRQPPACETHGASRQ